MTLMNRCCRDANEYLKKSDIDNPGELRLFIDNFNKKIENYSVNGLSSFLLGSIELCLKLSSTAGYTHGEAITRWLKGNTLSYGGRYKSAVKSYYRALKLVEPSDELYREIEVCLALNLAYIGDIESSVNLLEKFADNGCRERLFYPLALIYSHIDRNDVAISLLERDKYNCEYDTLLRVSYLIQENRVQEAFDLICSVECQSENDFIDAYKGCLSLLISAKNGNEIDLGVINSLINTLNSKKSYFHYLDGLITLSEVYYITGSINESESLLNRVVQSKKDITLLDLRVLKLRESLYTHIGDFSRAQEISAEIESYKKSFSSLESLERLYQEAWEEQVVS